MPSVHTVYSDTSGTGTHVHSTRTNTVTGAYRPGVDENHVNTQGDGQNRQNEQQQQQQEEQYVPLNDTILAFQPSHGDPHNPNDDDHDDNHDDAAAAVGDASSVGSAWAPLDSSSAQDGLEQHNGHDTTHQQHHHHPAENHHEPSFQDRLVGAATEVGSSALWGSLELLRIAGGLTLSTTGKLVAPPLKVTQQIVLPSLLAATLDYARQIIPVRIQDWFQIVTASLYHLYVVLRNTRRGAVFRSRLGMVGADLVDCISSDESRQVIADGMASVVKLSEAMQ